MQRNRIEIAGFVAARLHRLRYLPSGTRVANLRLGENYRYQGKDNQQIIHTNWHALTFYDDLADIALTYEKGDNLFVEGTMQQREFTPADGTKRIVHEVIVKSCHLIAPSHLHRYREGDESRRILSHGTLRVVCVVPRVSLERILVRTELPH